MLFRTEGSLEELYTLYPKTRFGETKKVLRTYSTNDPMAL